MSLYQFYPRLKGCIFIVTYGRSGSTLLQKALQTLPDSCIRGENDGILVQLYRAYQKANFARGQFGKLPTASDNPWFGADRIDPQSFGEQLSEVFIREIIRPQSNVRWVGFKEIRYSELKEDFVSFFDFARKVFPNLFIVFNSRNVSAVRESGWWAKMDPDNVAKIISEMDARFSSYSQSAPHCTFHAHHEETSTNPSSLSALFEMLGEPMDIERLRLAVTSKLTH
ncbi:MAG TPA: sulfotransferase [Devosiaceae bacterium]